jgi:hypothetical protein
MDARPLALTPGVANAEPSAWERHLCGPLAGRKVICAFEVLAGMTRLVPMFHRWETRRPLLIGDGQGTGPLPLETDADILLLDSPEAASLTEQVRARMDPTSRLTPEVVEAVERYDPDREAVWWFSPLPPNDPLLGRPVLGGRPATQIALEDKLVTDGLLDAIGAARAPTAVVPVVHRDLLAASERVREASGSDEVVWAGDNRDGVNGGGDYVRWIRTPEHAARAAAFFTEHCDLVRVSPFLDGVPCSIHGLVLPDGVVVLRPLELASLRDVEAGRFCHAGMGTAWDPPPADTESMRALARELGTHLRERAGYRGAFGLDGVLTATGFRVTELNPRFSGGMTRLAAAAPTAHLDLVQLNAVIGRDVGASAAAIEAATLAQLDVNRFIHVVGLSNQLHARETMQARVGQSSDGLHVVRDEDESAVATMLCGPSATGAFVRFSSEELAERGTRCAAIAIEALGLSDELWQTGFGALHAAPDVRV